MSTDPDNCRVPDLVEFWLDAPRATRHAFLDGLTGRLSYREMELESLRAAGLELDGPRTLALFLFARRMGLEAVRFGDATYPITQPSFDGLWEGGEL